MASFLFNKKITFVYDIIFWAIESAIHHPKWIENRISSIDFFIEQNIQPQCQLSIARVLLIWM